MKSSNFVALALGVLFCTPVQAVDIGAAIPEFNENDYGAIMFAGEYAVTYVSASIASREIGKGNADKRHLNRSKREAARFADELLPDSSSVAEEIEERQLELKVLREDIAEELDRDERARLERKRDVILNEVNVRNETYREGIDAYHAKKREIMNDKGIRRVEEINAKRGNIVKWASGSTAIYFLGRFLSRFALITSGRQTGYMPIYSLAQEMAKDATQDAHGLRSQPSQEGQ